MYLHGAVHRMLAGMEQRAHYSEVIALGVNGRSFSQASTAVPRANLHIARIFGLALCG